MVKKENDKKAKTYINMLMQCIADEEMFDESLIKYMLNYKSQELNEFNCKSETKYSIIIQYSLEQKTGTHFLLKMKFP